MTPGFESIIGLEVHAQILSESKLFCACSSQFGAPPNTHVCPVCLGLPGALPVPNRAVIEMAARAALALACQPRTYSRFARKNYFYPDLAKGYQISQFAMPLSEHGRLTLRTDGQERQVGITRIHLEEDAAKNLHGVGSGKHTLVDFNRAGVPLIEIVSEPDMRSSSEAEEYLKRLREVLMWIEVNDGNLEEGSFRCDANVSIRPRGESRYGTRVELKNINSFRFVRKAIDYELARQVALVSAGGEVVRETRTWNENQGKTLPMRGKEEAQDYRYFPDPDLPPLRLEQEVISGLRQSLPELPEPQRVRWQRELGLTAYDASVVGSHPKLARWFEDAVAALASVAKALPRETGKTVANFLQAEVMRHVTLRGLQASFPVSPEQLAELLATVCAGTLSGKMAKEVFAEMVATGASARSIIEAKGLAQLSNQAELEAIAQKVIGDNPAQVEQYRAGKANLIGYFVGQTMRATQGRANPKLVNQILRKLLA